MILLYMTEEDNEDLDLGFDFTKEPSTDTYKPKIYKWQVEEQDWDNSTPLTDPKGPYPLWFNPGAHSQSYVGRDGRFYAGEENLFRPKDQDLLPKQFSIDPVELGKPDTTDPRIHKMALDTFLNPNSSQYTPQIDDTGKLDTVEKANLYDNEQLKYMGSGRGGKTRKKKRNKKGNKGKRKTKSKRSKKSRRL